MHGDYKQCRNQAEPTPHVLIRGTGHRLGDTGEFLYDVLGQYGDVVDVQVPALRSHAVATMATPAQAQRVVGELSGHPALQSRSLTLTYCMPRGDPFSGLDDVSSTARVAVPGLRLVHDFITEEQEASLLAMLTGASGWVTLSRRRVLHFGVKFDYRTNDVDVNGVVPPLPPELQVLAERMHRDGLTPFRCDQVTVNEYVPGAGIPAHIDTHSAFHDGIASITAGAETVMTFTDDDGEGNKVDVLLPRRSLLVMNGAARYAWRHAIRCRRYDRIDGDVRERHTRTSFTFRAVNYSRSCTCAFESKCDRHVVDADRLEQVATVSEVDRDRVDVSPDVEREFVHAFYDTVADHFSSTRYKPWPLVERFLLDLPPHALIADIGCGNGKYLSCVKPAARMVGFDRCASLVAHCRKRLPACEVGIADALRVPLRSNSFDAACSVAVLHHIANRPRRIRLIAELARIVRPGGRIIIVAWAMEQDPLSRRRFTDRDCFVPWTRTRRFAADGNQDVVQRFCHVYAGGELADLIAEVPDLCIVSERFDRSNWVVIARKVVHN